MAVVLKIVVLAHRNKQVSGNSDQAEHKEHVGHKHEPVVNYHSALSVRPNVQQSATQNNDEDSSDNKLFCLLGCDFESAVLESDCVQCLLSETILKENVLQQNELLEEHLADEAQQTEVQSDVVCVAKNKALPGVNVLLWAVFDQVEHLSRVDPQRDHSDTEYGETCAGPLEWLEHQLGHVFGPVVQLGCKNELPQKHKHREGYVEGKVDVQLRNLEISRRLTHI